MKINDRIKERAMKKIGWIGTGVMGKSMCLHILKKGYPLSVYNLNI
jgi:3-hydroxyisobutyrate dehydrogenase